MRTVTYQLVGTSAVTTAVGAQAPVIRPGVVIGVQWTLRMVGGAAPAYYEWNACLNNISTNYEAINNPPREIIISRNVNWVTTSGIVTAITPMTACSIPVRVGDILSYSQLQYGTAATTMMAACLFVVQEAN